jgi:hypothetical protein
MERSGRRPCPECVKRYHAGKQDTIHYIPQGREMCVYCEDPDFVEKVRAHKDRLNRKKNAAIHRQYDRAHPTVKRVINGKWKEVRR